MQLVAVDPAIVSVWRWRGVVRTAVFAVLGVAGSAVAPTYLWPFLPLMIVLLGLSLAWFWPYAMYRHLRYGVDETGIVIQRGVLFRSHIALPRVRIQHTDVSQGPLERRFGVGALKLYTAGSRYTRIELPGLAHEDALALRDSLLAGEQGGGV